MLAQTSNNYISALNDRKTNTYSFYNLIFQNHPNSSWGRLNGDGVHTLRYYLLFLTVFLLFIGLSMQCGACLPYLPD